MNGQVLLLKFALIAVVLFATGCSNVGMFSPLPTLGSVATVVHSPAAAPSNEARLVVAFIKDGNIQLWDESKGQIQTILNTENVIDVTMSDDGQVIVFLGCSVVQLKESDGIE